MREAFCTQCHNRIEADRAALGLIICAACAAKTPGSFMRQNLQVTVTLSQADWDTVYEALSVFSTIAKDSVLITGETADGLKRVLPVIWEAIKSKQGQAKV
jgi:hypothetical protein